MKPLIVVFLGLTSMIYQDFENLIGRKVSEVSHLGIIEKSQIENAFWAYGSENEFLGRSYDRVFITTDSKETIEEITIYFPGILDKSFYNIISDEYGNADRIQVIDAIDEMERDTIDGQVLEESFISVREGDFDDKPYLIYWDKSDFQIRLFLDFSNNISTILFRRPKKGF